jgi:ubiquinone/menaquinone biosynthesis C-methylase UbiE
MAHGTHTRTMAKLTATNLSEASQTINSHLASGRYLDALDLIEHVVSAFPQVATRLLAQAYDIFQQLPDKDTRYSLYQSRFYNFPVAAADKVLDIGSGHLPFPMATHLADFATEDHNYGRAGIPFKHVKGKPVFNCNVEQMPFEDKYFDFVYCSHVLEHTEDPIKACRELMRVAKRGYLETPTRAKDLFLNTAKVSNHHWMVDYFNDRLVFTEYNESQLAGLESDLLMSMHCNPETEREKAFSTLILLKADKVNTMFMWEGGFDVEVRRIGTEPEIYTWKSSQIPLRSPDLGAPLSGAVQLYC